MQPYVRTHPEFSLCGLPCGLCPRRRTDGPSRCPGCGGAEFHEKHPACGIITCSLKHGGPAYCSDCADYPCARYREMPALDSFISYAHVRSDLDRIKTEGSEGLLAELAQKMALLDRLLTEWDDGRSKAYYCLAAQLLPLELLTEVLDSLGQDGASAPEEAKARAGMARVRIEGAAESLGISLRLRKKETPLRIKPEDPA